MTEPKPEPTEEEKQKRAQNTMRLDGNPDFHEYLKSLEHHADDVRRMAENADPEKVHERLQLLDMARGIDQVVINWEDSVAEAKEILKLTDPDAPAKA